MLNIIKNSFIMFYKYLPILIPLGLISPVYSYFYPISNHSISTTLISGFCCFLILLFLTNSKPYLNTFLKKLSIFIIAYFAFSAFYKIANNIFYEYGIEKFLHSIKFFYNFTGYFILETMTQSYIRFCYAVFLVTIITQEKLITKNIFSIINKSYWKILLLITIIELPTFYPIYILNGSLSAIILQWYTNSIFYCIIINFYKAKKEGTV